MKRFILLVALFAVLLAVFAQTGDAKSAIKKRSTKNLGAKIDMAAVKKSIMKVKDARRSKRETEVNVLPLQGRKRRAASAVLAETVKRNVENLQNAQNKINKRAKRSLNNDAAVKKQRVERELKNRRARAVADQNAKFNKKIISKLAKVKNMISRNKK